MKHKMLAYAFVPALGLSVLGAQVASAHGFFGGATALSPEQVATRQQTMFQSEAQILGIGIDELKTAWAEGKSLQQIMREKGISQEQVMVRMKEVHTQQLKAQLDTLVEKGVITRAQADKRFEVMKSRIQSSKGRQGMKFYGGFH